MLKKLKVAVENKIKSLNVDEKSLIVLKGIKLSLFENVDVTRLFQQFACA